MLLNIHSFFKKCFTGKRIGPARVPLPPMNLNMLLILLRKEFLLEFRQRYAISGIVLYVFSMIFVVYISSIKVQPQVWNILFWLIPLAGQFINLWNWIEFLFVKGTDGPNLYGNWAD